ncbi:MAG: DUF5615 family PIN-like protein [Candidatus Thorarchaeota archaeon]
MKFLADSMLGKLARFLRIFGYNTVYANDLVELYKVDPVPDHLLIDYAKKNERIIITKDYHFYKSYKENSIFLEGEGVYNYLRQLKKENGLSFKFNLKKARCSVCNSNLERIVKKDSIKNLVLRDTFNSYNDFYQCSNVLCKKVYWQGSHIEDIQNKLNRNTESN